MGLTRCRRTDKAQRKLLEFFVLEDMAWAASDLVGMRPNTTTLFYRKILMIIGEKLEAAASAFSGEIELDESYFGGVRKSKRGRGAAGKVPVFGILKRGGTVYIQSIDNTRTDTLMPIIRSKIKPDSIVYTASYRSSNALGVPEFKNYRVNHSQVFVEGCTHINRMENFGNQANRVLRKCKYSGIPAKQFYGFLKECEFRLNSGSNKPQISSLKKWYHL